MTHEAALDRQESSRGNVARFEATGSAMSAAAVTWRPRIEPGMNVAGVAGDVVGQVVGVRPDVFVLHRAGSLGMAPTSPVALPFERIHAILNGRITLDIPSSQVDEHGTPAHEA